MSVDLASSAPHIHDAKTVGGLEDWGVQPDAIEGEPRSSGLLLHKSADGKVESGLRVCTPGAWRLGLPGDELCCFISGRATYREHDGDTIDVAPGTVVRFPSGWTGRCDVRETMRSTYMLSLTPATIDRGATPILRNPETCPTPADWGPVPTMIEGRSMTSGRLIHKGPGGVGETGIWVCTPGFWKCLVTSDEHCHFLSGRCTYTHESGEIVEIRPDTVAFFPKGWKGTCRIHDTVRKVYMIR